jgi:hypothetical protein
VADAFPAGARDRFAHAGFVNFVRARVRDRHDPRRQSGGIELRVQDLLPHAVDRHPAERLVTVVNAPTTSNSPARLTS